MDKFKTVKEALSMDDGEVTVKGWVYRKRGSDKFKFIILRDATGIIQTVVSKEEVNNNDWDNAVALSRSICNQSPQYAQMLQALWNRIDRQIEPSLEKELAMNNIEQMINECEY